MKYLKSSSAQVRYRCCVDVLLESECDVGPSVVQQLTPDFEVVDVVVGDQHREDVHALVVDREAGVRNVGGGVVVATWSF